MSNLSPLVSVMMPCYNAAETLPVAIASLVAQTYERWECIVVDDGSNDNPERVVRRFADDRIRLHRFDTNRGRGAARQLALEHARGEFLSFLDADDWLFPDKLRRQVEVFEQARGVGAVSCAVAVLDADGTFLGVSGGGVGGHEVATGRFDRLGRPPFPYVSTMIRMELTRGAAYDAQLRRSQDLDFLLQTTLGSDYAVITEPLYAYTGWAHDRQKTFFECLSYERAVFRKYRGSYPLRSSVIEAQMWVRTMLFSGLFLLNAQDGLLQRKMTKTADATARFARAEAAVIERLGQTCNGIEIGSVRLHGKSPISPDT